jgi:hypothetical protein
MKSVNLDGIVRVTGDTIVNGFYHTVVVNESEAVVLRVKNITEETLTVRYTNEKKPVRLKIKPGKSVFIELSYIPGSGKLVSIKNKYSLAEYMTVWYDKPQVKCVCNYCGTLLECDGCAVCDE